MNKFDELYSELFKISEDLLPYYDIDKVKPYSVYVWSKEEGDEFGENLFDIEANRVVFYDKKHRTIKETLPIIIKIQDKMKEIEEYEKQMLKGEK